MSASRPWTSCWSRRRLLSLRLPCSSGSRSLTLAGTNCWRCGRAGEMFWSRLTFSICSCEMSNRPSPSSTTRWDNDNDAWFISPKILVQIWPTPGDMTLLCRWWYIKHWLLYYLSSSHDCLSMSVMYSQQLGASVLFLLQPRCIIQICLTKTSEQFFYSTLEKLNAKWTQLLYATCMMCFYVAVSPFRWFSLSLSVTEAETNPPSLCSFFPFHLIFSSDGGRPEGPIYCT